MLGVCERTFRWYIDRHKEEGLPGLIDKRLSPVSHRQVPVDEVMRLVKRYWRRHEGWSAKPFYAIGTHYTGQITSYKSGQFICSLHPAKKCLRFRGSCL